MIHPTAIVHPQAKLDPTVQVGPYAVIDQHIELGPHCILGPYVFLTGTTTLGAHNRLFAGCVLGEAPQDLKYKDAPTRLVVGNHNVFRENVTVHRSTDPAQETVIGSHNFFMTHSHVAHNCRIGDRVILANGALLGGYAAVADRAFISGNCLVHQFVRVGTLALMQGGAAISKDLPPYTVARGDNGICGLNTVGLRRAGFSAGVRAELKQLYRALFREGQNLRSAVADAQKRFSSPEARIMLNFLAASKRGVCFDTGLARSEDQEKADESD